MYLTQIYDSSLSQYAYLIGCQRTGEALIIDPERDIDRYLEIAEANDLRITAVTETHIHADFLSGTREFLHELPEVTAYLSDMGTEDWKYTWAVGDPRVRLLRDGDSIEVGNIQVKAVHTPGHTPEHLSFLIIDRGGGANEPMGMATGDFVFVGDVGRPDLLESAAGQVGAREPAARDLYRSILKFGMLPDFIQILPGHGAGSACGKALGAVPSSTAGYEKRYNKAITTAVEEGEQPFVDSILEGQPEPPVYFARMKQLNKEGPAVLGGLPTLPKMSAEDFCALAGQDDSVILDMSTKDRGAFMSRHLKGSLFAPPGDKFSVVAGSYVSPEENIYLLLRSELELGEAVRNLIRIGFDKLSGYAVLSEIESSDIFQSSVRSTPQATTRDIKTLLEEHDPNAVVLDVRGAGEYAAGHVPDAINIAHTRLANHLDSLPDKKLLVHCGSGLRASLAVPFLERHGKDLIFCDGPFSDWDQ